MNRRALWVVGLVAALAPHAWAEPPIKSYVDPPQGARCSYNHFPEVIYTGDHSYATIYTRQVHEKIDCIGRTDACEDGSDQCRCHDERRTDADIAGATMGTLKTLLAVAACAAMIGETGPVAVGLCFAISGIEGAQAGRQLTEVYAAATDGCDDPGDPGTEIGPIPLEGARAKLELWQVFDEVRSVGVSATCECYVDHGFWAGEELAWSWTANDSHTFAPLDITRDRAEECGTYLDGRVSSYAGSWMAAKRSSCESTCKALGGLRADFSGTHGVDRGLAPNRVSEFYKLISYVAGYPLWTCPSQAQTCGSPATVAREAVCPGARPCGDVLPADGFDDCSGALLSGEISPPPPPPPGGSPGMPPSGWPTM